MLHSPPFLNNLKILDYHASRITGETLLNKMLIRPTVLAMNLQDYVAILQRRKTLLLLPFVVIFLPALIVAFILPPVYQSKATILVEGQGIPQEFVETTVTGFVQERVQAIAHRLLTESKLRQVVEKFDLYPDQRSPETMPDILARMRNAIKIEMVDVEINNPSKRDYRSTVASVSFTVSFDYKDPLLAQKVTNELVDLFLEENQKVRTQKTEEVTEFLKQEAGKYQQQISEIEKRLAAFKQANIELLPERSDLNLNFANQISTQLDQADQRIRSLEGQVASLQSQLSMTEPNLPTQSSLGTKPLLSPAQQLKSLQAEYIQAREKYSPEHPDIKRLKSQIAALEQTLRTNPDNSAFAPDNPAFISLRAQLESTKAELVSARQEKSLLRQKLDEYQERLLKAPAVERDYLILTRDYEIARKNYEDIQDKLQKAGLAQQLEEESMGEKFTLMDPATTPSSPIKPNRPAIAFLGFILTFGSGLGLIFLTEHFDQTVRGFRGVTAILHAPPLAAIPLIETPSDIARKRRFRQLTVMLTLLTTVIALILAHSFWKPIDQWWPGMTPENDNSASTKGIAAIENS